MLGYNNHRKIPWILIITFVLITILISAAGLYIYRIQQKELREEIHGDLSSISKLKTEQIVAWHNERRRDINVFSQLPYFIDVIQQWQDNPGDKLLKTKIMNRINLIKVNYDYENIYLTSNKGELLLSLDPNDKNIDSTTIKKINEAVNHHKITFTDFYFCPTHKKIHYDIIAGVYNEKNIPIAALLFRINPHTYLYPLIQSWPTTSKTAETLLIRRENNHILFLNELRHKKNTALTLTRSISDTTLPATKAGLGYSGIFEGIDYRGVKVLADLVQIPGTKWSMVAKVDVEEIYSPLRERALLIFLFALALIIIAFVSSVLIWRHQRSVFYREKYKLETERKVLEKHFAYLIKNANDIIILLNEDGKIIEANDRALLTYGYTRDEFLGLNINDIRSKETVELITEQMEKVRLKGGLLFETEHRRKDGTKFSVEVSSRTMEIDNAVYYQSIVRDITERKLADEEIRKLYRGVEQSPATIVITDRQGNIEYVNNKFCETTGYTFAEVIGKNPRILKSGEKTKEEYELLWKTVLSGDEWRGEFHNKKKNGELYWEFASISPIKNEKDEITHFIAIKEDITDRKRMMEELILAKDKAEKSEKVKTEFLAQMSHEIRTPINIILGFNSFIKEELKKNITEELSESFDSIESASKRIMRTVDLILNMSEIQTGTVTASRKDLDISEEVLSTLYMEYKQQAERKNLSFIYSVMTGDTKVFADDYLATHIFTNLIDNAVKYTEKGRIEIVINRNDQNKLCVEVKDTGIGISEEFIPKLFDAFTQEDHGYSRKYEGNGLGLALVKKYCELNNARIKVESTKGVGSVFRVIFN